MDEESPDGVVFKDHDFSSDLLRQLNGLRQSKFLTDVSICSGAWEVPCHRNVLASSSPYFKAMFCSHFRESREAKVQLKGISATTLEQVITYAYTGEVHISAANVLPLMEAAAMLQYPRVFEACSSYLQSQLDPSNCLGLVRLAEVLSCESLKKKAREVALTRFPEVAASADLKELCAVELRGYLGDDRLCGEEETVFEALMAWVKHDLKARWPYLQGLLEQVRLPYIHPAFFHHFIANDALLQSSPACQAILEVAGRQIFSSYGPSAQDCKLLWHIPPRSSYQDFLLLLGGRKDNQQTTRDVLLYSLQTGRWQSLAKLPARLYKASAVTLHRSVYVLGGMAVSEGKSLLSRGVYVFSLKLNQWRPGEPMLAARYSHRSTSHRNFIFSIGGTGEGQELLGSMERYDSIRDVWESMADMPVAVLHPAVAVKDQRLYLFGGVPHFQKHVVQDGDKDDKECVCPRSGVGGEDCHCGRLHKEDSCLRPSVQQICQMCGHERPKDAPRGHSDGEQAVCDRWAETDHRLQH
ncbi:kelch-like protein 38 isoform X2 [Peromyscus maniculatus bairdii]|uniref:kelch-like protein 38 isoform X2 n=1 Tax=Peromyscus maniculatus bairdii TaxID=230844 RepID=UPI00042AF19D|nr:kelch-like protein 38 isoform X2 [Peromyscus maniculatus bairdii]